VKYWILVRRGGEYWDSCGELVKVIIDDGDSSDDDCK